MTPINCGNFQSALNAIVDHLERVDQLNHEQAERVSALVQKLMGDSNFKSVRRVTLFQLNIVRLSVERMKLDVEVLGCASGKSDNYRSIQLAYGKEVSEKMLFCDSIDFIRKERV